MTELSSDEITQYLAGVSKSSFVRTKEHILQEYNVNKYGSFLSKDFKTPDEVRQAETSLSETIVISRDKRFYWVNALQTYQHHEQEVVDLLNGHEANCELGCGYGFYVSKLKAANACGGEFTENGVLLAKWFGLNVHRFDFYNAGDYAFIPPNSVVYTSHALEQLPSALPFIENLRPCKPRLVIHLEPTVFADTDEISQARNSYIERNDYCRDLEKLLLSTKDIEVLSVKHDIIGINPLNPTNLYIWKFRVKAQEVLSLGRSTDGESRGDGCNLLKEVDV